MTPTLAGVALALAVRPDTPEKSHLGVPQALTHPSRKSSPRLPETLTEASRMCSPTRPAAPHRCAPERLTDASRRYSPATPGKAHRMLPYRLTSTIPEKLTGGSRKISPFGQALIFEAEIRRQIRVGTSRKTVTRDRNRGKRYASRDACRMRVVVSVANRQRHVRRRFARETGSNARHGIRDRKHPQRAGKPGTSTAYGVRTRRAADGRYGCSFILKPTTPGSSVVDTAKPHDFASAIIAEFSRSASPIIHAVPRERA